MAFTRLHNTTLGVVKEVVSGTYQTPLATNAILPNDDITPELNRDPVEDNTINGSLTRNKPSPGAYGEIGLEFSTYARPSSTGTIPEQHALLESVFGSQVNSTDNTVDNTLVDATTTVFKVTSAIDLQKQQLILVDSQDNGNYSIAQIVDISGQEITIWPPLPAAPVDEAPIRAGTNFILTDKDHPTLSALLQYDGDKKVEYSGCKPASLGMAFEVGQRVPMTYSLRSKDYVYGVDTPVDFAGNLDTSEGFFVCLGMDFSSTYSGVAKGVPTATETIIENSDFSVKIGDKILLETATEWETASITNFSGQAGQDITITHTAVTAAVSAGDIVYVVRSACSNPHDTAEITLEMEVNDINCMAADYGKHSLEYGMRTLTVSKSPFFKTWQDLALRDGAVNYELLLGLGMNNSDKKMFIYMPAVQNTEFALTSDTLVKNDITAVGTGDERIGNKNEIVIAFF